MCVIASMELHHLDGPPPPQRGVYVKLAELETRTHRTTAGKKTHKIQVLVCGCGSLTTSREILLPTPWGPCQKRKESLPLVGVGPCPAESIRLSVFQQLQKGLWVLNYLLSLANQIAGGHAAFLLFFKQ